MIISALKVLELNKKHNLIKNLSEREFKNPEGTVLDLRVGRVERPIGESYLGIEGRISPKTELVGDVTIDGEKRITIRPGEYLLVRTMEVIHSPPYKIKFDDSFPEMFLVPKISPRSSLQRSCVSLDHAPTTPGYEGELTFGIMNNGKHDFHFDLGARMFSIEYYPVIGDINRPYTGQHQRGRVTSEGKEEIQT